MHRGARCFLVRLGDPHGDLLHPRVVPLALAGVSGGHDQGVRHHLGITCDDEGRLHLRQPRTAVLGGSETALLVLDPGELVGLHGIPRAHLPTDLLPPGDSNAAGRRTTVTRARWKRYGASACGSTKRAPRLASSSRRDSRAAQNRSNTGSPG